MPTFAANLTMLFQEVPFLDRFKLARHAGFDFVEYLFPYEWPHTELKAALDDNQLKQVLFNLPPGDWAGGERGIACLPDRISEFEEGVESAIAYASRLGVKQVNCLSGLKPEGIAVSSLRDTFVRNLDSASRKFADHDMTLLIEPINSRIDMPGFFLDTWDLALDILEEAKLPNLKIQFDLYHMQIMHGDLLRKLTEHLDKIGHIQFADNPGRHEPGTGEINFAIVFEHLDALGYSGWASAEYLPLKNTENSLAWLQTFN